MKNNPIIKYCVMALFLVGGISCGQEQADVVLQPEESVGVIPEDTAEPDPKEKPYAVVEIENLQTQLYVFKPTDLDEATTRMWYPKQESTIFHCLSVLSFKAPLFPTGIRFGYVDDENRTIICEVSDFPEEALQWEGILVYWGNRGDPAVMRVNIRMSGTVRLYSKDTENGVERFGTLELTSIAKDDGKKTIDFGMYTETFPGKGVRGINVVNEDRLFIVNYHPLFVFDEETQEEVLVRDDSRGIYSNDEYQYKILDNVIYIRLIESSGTVSEHEGNLYIHIIDDSKFEIDFLDGTTASLPYKRIIMTFEKTIME
jgi:hypothetical protein